MNIKLYTSKNTPYSSYHTLPPVSGRIARLDTDKADGANRNYDKITLNRSQTPVEGMSFARMLAREAAAKVEKGASPEHVADLKQQVAAGTYQPDARQIAQRMLGYC